MQAQHLAVTIIAPEHSKILNLLAEACSNNQCLISDLKMNAQAKDHIIMLYITGSWNAIAKLETQLNNLATQEKAIVHMQRTEPNIYEVHHVPYIVHVTSLSSPDNAAHLLQFFVNHSIKISEMSINRFFASRTQALMQTINIVVLIPAELHLAELRENFILFCDEYNLDAIFEPDRP